MQVLSQYKSLCNFVRVKELEARILSSDIYVLTASLACEPKEIDDNQSICVCGYLLEVWLICCIFLQRMYKQMFFENCFFPFIAFISLSLSLFNYNLFYFRFLAFCVKSEFNLSFGNFFFFEFTKFKTYFYNQRLNFYFILEIFSLAICMLSQFRQSTFLGRFVSTS